MPSLTDVDLSSNRAFYYKDDVTIRGSTHFILLSQIDIGALQRFFHYPSFFHTFTLTSLSHATPFSHIIPHFSPAQRYPHISPSPLHIIICKTLRILITTPSTPPQVHSTSSMNEKTQKRGNAKWSFIPICMDTKNPLPCIIVVCVSSNNVIRYELSFRRGVRSEESVGSRVYSALSELWIGALGRCLWHWTRNQECWWR